MRSHSTGAANPGGGAALVQPQRNKELMTRAFTLKHTRLRENDIEDACLDLLRWRKYYPIRLQSGKFKTVDGRWITVGEPGLPDYVIPAFFLETKRPGGKLTPDQEQKIWELEAGYELQTAIIHEARDLTVWLDRYEAKIRGP